MESKKKNIDVFLPKGIFTVPVISFLVFFVVNRWLWIVLSMIQGIDREFYLSKPTTGFHVSIIGFYTVLNILFAVYLLLNLGITLWGGVKGKGVTVFTLSSCLLLSILLHVNFIQSRALFSEDFLKVAFKKEIETSRKYKGATTEPILAKARKAFEESKYDEAIEELEGIIPEGKETTALHFLNKEEVFLVHDAVLLQSECYEAKGDLGKAQGHALLARFLFRRYGKAVEKWEEYDEVFDRRMRRIARKRR
ncbi:MAG: hypothetical protein ACYTHM_04950 [Planctomycetota bacterium]|jgi:hypothetical protein